MIYEARRSGTVLCYSKIENLGYSQQTIKEMASAGIHIYCNGKRVKPPKKERQL